jgi:hypothetical protein
MCAVNADQILGREGTAFGAGAGHPLVLEGRRAWWVEAGQIDLFSLPMEGGRAVGSRSHLLRLGAGSLVVGAGGAGDAARARLLGIGGAGTRLRELSEADLRAILARPDTAGPVAGWLDVWVEALCDYMARGAAPEACHDVDAPSTLACPQETRIRPRQRAAWVRHQEAARCCWGARSCAWARARRCRSPAGRGCRRRAARGWK